MAAAFTADDVIWNLKQGAGSRGRFVGLGLMVRLPDDRGPIPRERARRQAKEKKPVVDANAIEKLDDFTVRSI